MILVDQFEEIFTLCENEHWRRAFVDNLVYAAKYSTRPVLLVITLRSDFHGHCFQYEELSALISDYNYPVAKMKREQIREAIVEPARWLACSFEPGLVERLLGEMPNTEGSLPLLQDTLRELWELKRQNTITHAALDQLGGLAGALNKRAENIFVHLSERKKDLCKKLFLRLIRVQVGAEDTKRRIKSTELYGLGNTREMEDLIGELSGPDGRLLLMQSDVKDRNIIYVEIAHEALIGNWGRLGSWIDEARGSLLTLSRLEKDTEAWLTAKEDPSYLFRGSRLAEIKLWVDDYEGAIGPDERKFINRSIQQEKDEEQAEQKRLELENQRKAAALEAERIRVQIERKRRRRSTILISTALAIAFFPWRALFGSTKSKKLKRIAKHWIGCCLVSARIS